MKIAELNMTHEGSTGSIMLQTARCARHAGHEVKTYSMKSFSFHQGPKPHPVLPGHTYVGSYVSRGFHVVMGVLTGANGLFSVAATLKLLRELDAFAPDVVHLHNLHQFCVNFPLLFRYIKKRKLRVVWTLHDCWALTGHCAHFDYVGCEKWKTECCDCPQRSSYPSSKIDHSSWMHRLKKKWFTGIENMTLVAPSEWLAGVVQQSFLGCYPVKVIKNGIDLEQFKPTPSDFREVHQCTDKYLLLDVAFGFGHKKGLDVLLELQKRLGGEYQLVLVGVDDAVKAQLPDGVIAIEKTDSPNKLAEIYTAADVFVNPTREEVLGLVNLEALACGTPVVTFHAGGSPECIDETCGVVVDRDDVDAMQAAIEWIRSEKPFSAQACVNRARLFDKNQKYVDYVKLYEEQAGNAT